MSQEDINNLQNSYQSIIFINIPKVVEYAYDPTTFFYKSYALYECSKISKAFIYSDATNVFNRKVDYYQYLIDNSILLPYNNIKLINKHWTTKLCLNKMNGNSYKEMYQYWAGFQVYVCDEENKNLIKEMYEAMCDKDIATPNTSIKYPDGTNEDCVEHRQDQSVLSLLIQKNYRNQYYNHERQQLFGDWQTFYSFDNNYRHDLNNCALSSRESKFGNMRFINE